MKLSGTCLALGVVPLVILTCAQVTGGGSGAPSDVRAGTARLAEDVPLVGVGAVHALHPGDEHVAENLIGILEAIQPWVTVTRVEVAVLMCDTLESVPDADLLQFAISPTKTVTAEREFRHDPVLDRDNMPTGKDHKAWFGTIGLYTTVSITWSEPCTAKYFLLKIDKSNADGSFTSIETMPCTVGSSGEAGPSVELCIVQYRQVFNALR